MKHGFVKVAAAAPFVRVADCSYNIDQHEALIRQSVREGVEILTFPELSITGYTCGDLFLQPFLIREAEKALCQLADRTKDTHVLVIVGMPLRVKDKLFNTAVVLQEGQILGVVPKTFLPNYREFEEKRWFSSSLDLGSSKVEIGGREVPIGSELIYQHRDMAFAIEICEDLWAPITPGTQLALSGADIIFNLSASNEVAGKHHYLRSLISTISFHGVCGYVYASCGFGESSTDLVYTGKAFIAENGVILEEMERFELTERLIISDIDVEQLRHERMVNSTYRTAASLYGQREDEERGHIVPIQIYESKDYQLSRMIERQPFMPSTLDLAERCAEMWHIQVSGLAQRLHHLKGSKVVLGISGGLDSTLMLMVAVRTIDMLGRDRKDIIAVTMPGPGTSHRTYDNAVRMMELLGVTNRELSIVEATHQHLLQIGHDAKTQDVTFENAQARERTQILMDIANMEGGFVLGPGDLSELALGWTTYNGDHASMYAVNATIPKSAVQLLVQYIAEHGGYGEEVSKILMDVVATPVSPELKKEENSEKITQHTEQIIGPYEVHDFYLYHTLYSGYPPEKLFFMAHRAFEGIYTREQLKQWLIIFVRRFFSQQYKRSFLPDGPKVTNISLSPRVSWRMPSDATSKMWLDVIENL